MCDYKRMLQALELLKSQDPEDWTGGWTNATNFVGRYDPMIYRMGISSQYHALLDLASTIRGSAEQHHKRLRLELSIEADKLINLINLIRTTDAT